MSARDDFPVPPTVGSRAGSGQALINTLDGWRAQREAMCDEIDRLRAWKAEAMVVLTDWEAVWEAAGRPGPLGGSKARNVLAWMDGIPASQA